MRESSAGGSDSSDPFSHSSLQLVPLLEAEQIDYLDSQSESTSMENESPSPPLPPVMSTTSTSPDEKLTRGTLNLGLARTDGVQTSTQNVPVNVEQRGSKTIDGELTSHNFHKSENNNKNTHLTVNGSGVGNTKNNQISRTMDDDSLGLRSAGGSSPPHQREPEGDVPRHRIGESRRFSDDLYAIVSKELDDDRETSTSDNEVRPLQPPSPPQVIKEISIREDIDYDEDGNEGDGDGDEVSEPSAAVEVVRISSTPSPAPLKATQAHSPTEPQDSWKPMNDSFEIMNTPHRGEQSLRPPSIPDQTPQESDLSVYSIHSGFAIQDPHAPRIVPGMMVQSPAPYAHPYATLTSQIHPALQSQHSNGYSQHYQHHPYAPPPPPVVMAPPSIGKRKVHFRLVEDLAAPTWKGVRGSFLSFRRGSNRNLLAPSPMMEESQQMERGRVTVSWYEGTNSLELTEHVRNAIIRKVGLEGTIKLAEFRIMDDTSNPPEEIVLSPYIPSGSRLLIRFTTRDASGEITPPYGRHPSYIGGAPESPSAAPSPHTSALDLHGLGLNSNQLALLGARLKGLQIPEDGNKAGKSGSTPPKRSSSRVSEHRRSKADRINEIQENNKDEKSKEEDGKDDQSSVFEMQSLHPEDSIQKSLQNITELLMMERQKVRYYPRQEKRQVVFTLANYFVLFLSLIAISAEIQARAPEWNAAIERHLNSVKNCSKDQDALFECVSNGDFSGLVASVILWLSRSAATKRIFLFGFDSPRKLWTVVYESLVTAVCWGFSYMFIRRGLNPDTNRNFLQKYWKDAVYGSLAGFNAAFMKGVLKNLIPQEAIEDALQQRQVKILSWLPSFA